MHAKGGRTLIKQSKKNKFHLYQSVERRQWQQILFGDFVGLESETQQGESNSTAVNTLHNIIRPWTRLWLFILAASLFLCALTISFLWPAPTLLQLKFDGCYNDTAPLPESSTMPCACMWGRLLVFCLRQAILIDKCWSNAMEQYFPAWASLKVKWHRERKGKLQSSSFLLSMTPAEYKYKI